MEYHYHENVGSHDYNLTQESEHSQTTTIQTQSIGTKKLRKQNLWIWEHVTLDPTNENICYCNYYGTGYTCPKGRDVSHISRHLTKCIAAHNKDDNTDLRQSKLHVGFSGIVNWKYSA